MTQHCKVTLGNVSCNTVSERVFQSKNAAFVWLNHQMVRLAANPNINELYFRIESYDPMNSDFFRNNELNLPF